MQGEFGVPVVKSASGNVRTVAGQMLGFYVNTTSSGVVQFYDDAATGTTTAISGAITPAAGSFHRFPATFANGLNMVLNSGSINVTLFMAS
jgi:hypothetical protein